MADKLVLFVTIDSNITKILKKYPNTTKIIILNDVSSTRTLKKNLSNVPYDMRKITSGNEFIKSCGKVPYGAKITHPEEDYEHFEIYDDIEETYNEAIMKNYIAKYGENIINKHDRPEQLGSIMYDCDMCEYFEV